MPVDDKYKAEMRMAILDYIKKKVEAEKSGSPADSAKDEPLMLKMIGIQINAIDNEIVKDVVICEDENGKTAKVLREQDAYIVPEVEEAWAERHWWEDHRQISLGEATLAVAYDYLLQENIVMRQKFADSKDAALFVYQTMCDLKQKDDFVNKSMEMLRDFYPELQMEKDV